VRRRQGLPTLAEINVTSLVDVAFTLLVIFIITAPILQGGVELQLPRADSRPITSAEGVIVSIERSGAIHLGEVPVAGLEELEALYPDYVRERGAETVYLRADGGVDYERVVRVLGALMRLVVAEVSLVVEPRES
jgi:biopolymer transport protein ExbD/biopolymer transport protein TolR